MKLSHNCNFSKMKNLLVDYIKYFILQNTSFLKSLTSWREFDKLLPRKI